MKKEVEQPATCPSCGAAAVGKFCHGCGQPLVPTTCSTCGTPLPPGGKFCGECGLPASERRAGPRAFGHLVPWGIGVALLVVVLGLVVRAERGPSVQPAAPSLAQPGTPPDISQMSPRERFDRLYNRVMRASESGDTAQVSQFTPMAMMAYAALDAVDADARYHAAMLRLHTGDPVGAQFLADTILTNHPTHLFGLLIEGALARWNQDEPGRVRVEQRYLEVYDEEIAGGRPEYREHATALQNFRDQATR